MARYKYIMPEFRDAMPLDHRALMRLAVMWGWLACHLGWSRETTLARSKELTG